MKDLKMNRTYSARLKYKILFGFLFSMLPLLIIVISTYFSAKESALQSSHNQIGLISNAGGEKLNAFFRSGANTFSELTKEDVFGMAIEFDAIDELEQHFTTFQTRHPQIDRILITNENGEILGKNQGVQNQHSAPESRQKGRVKEISLIQKGPERSVLLVDFNTSEKTQPSSAPSLLYSFRTSNSSGQPNGYFLVYMDLTRLTDNAEGILFEMKKNGFATSSVVIVNTSTEETVSYLGRPLSNGVQRTGPPLQKVLKETTYGEVNIFTTATGTEHTVFIPLIANPTLSDKLQTSPDGLSLGLLIAVDENEIMAKVRRILKISITISGIGVLAIIFIGFFTIRSITGPIANLVDVLQQYSGGDSTVRAELKSHDEIGYFTEEFNTMLEHIDSSGTALQDSEARYRTLFENLQLAVNNKDYGFRFPPRQDDDDLSGSLNKMLETLENADSRTKEENWLKTGLTQLSEKVSGEHQLEDLCENAITFIANYTGVQVGTLFAINRENNECYELIASYAFRKRKGLANRYKKGEGLIGQAALEKKVIHFTEIPEDYIWIESSLGMTPPHNILVIPLIYEGNVLGIIELGASFNFDQRYLDFSQQVSSVVAVAINAAIANDRLKELLEHTRKQSDTLQSQQDDLQQANTELEEQTETLKESEARLKVQQEELQASNEEMEEKNQMLEEQKRENQEKNRNLKEKQREIEDKAEQLKLATKYKSEFLSNMSHELRTPLNSMLLLAKILADNEEKNLNDDQIESANSIHRGGQTLLHLINDILDLSKIEAGRVELSISSTQPKHIATDFELEFNPLAKNRELDFKTELAKDLPKSISTDVHRLEQIIRNLLGNAFKFTESGSVVLRFARPTAQTEITRSDLSKQNSVAISVIDTGFGIPDEKLDLIFEAFKQVDGSISRRHGGTGLGLSISRELANILGGELSAQSTLNQGTTFTLIIPEIFTNTASPEHVEVKLVNQRKETKQPLIKVAESLAESLPVELPALVTDNFTSSDKSILIIEDDKEFSTILSNFFKKNGYTSIIASTGEIGIKYAIDYKPTAVILDIGLPGIDGWTVLSELKNNADTRHIPVHIMSAYDETSEGLKKGAVGYLTKPVSIEGLSSALGKIEHVLENKVKELLVVEDDKGLRNNILKLMATQDIHATAAGTGSEALNLLRSSNFDCMILDLGLPDISGFSLLDEIEKDFSISRIPIIIYTGRDLTREETDKLEEYSSSIVLKSALSMERLLDETALFMHRVEQEMPNSHRKMIQEIRDKDSTIKGRRVLLVDDDMRNAFALSKFLKSRGVHVTIANNGKKALELLASDTRPDIVLMDIMMPVMDGYEAMKKIRKMQEYKDLPILAITAKAMETDREECIRCGASDYLSKPIDTTKLLSMLRIWMY